MFPAGHEHSPAGGGWLGRGAIDGCRAHEAVQRSEWLVARDGEMVADEAVADAAAQTRTELADRFVEHGRRASQRAPGLPTGVDRRRCAKPCTAGGCCPSRRVHRRGHRALDAFPVSGAALASPGGGPFPADIPAAGSGGHTRHRGGLRLDDALGPELDRASLVALPTPVCQVDGDRILAEVLTVDHSGNVALAAEAAELTAIGCSSGHLRPGAWSS